MRCTDVILELTVPTGDLDPTALGGHLDRCPACASFAARNARLDRCWEATRPPELSAQAWDRIWGNVSEALDRSSPRVAAPAPAPTVHRPWQRPAVALLALAQAAAILAMFTVAWHAGGPRRPAPAVNPFVSVPAPAVGKMVSSEKVDVDVAPGSQVVISFDGPIRRVRELALNVAPNAVDPFYSMFNEVESLAGWQ